VLQPSVALHLLYAYLQLGPQQDAEGMQCRYRLVGMASCQLLPRRTLQAAAMIARFRAHLCRRHESWPAGQLQGRLGGRCIARLPAGCQLRRKLLLQAGGLCISVAAFRSIVEN
jgi:hypothetical protein